MKYRVRIKEETLPEGFVPQYVTVGKWYDVIDIADELGVERGGKYFRMLNDNGNVRGYWQTESAHLKGGSWEVEEVE
jgi:hypothetical protein